MVALKRFGQTALAIRSKKASPEASMENIAPAVLYIDNGIFFSACSEVYELDKEYI